MSDSYVEVNLKEGIEVELWRGWMRMRMGAMRGAMMSRLLFL